MIIGVTGTFAAGKDTISDHLQKKGFFHFSLSDAIRNEAERRGLPKDRDTLRNLGREMGETMGADILAKRAVAAAGKTGAKNVVFTSIRRTPEVKFLKSQPKFVLLNVDAPIEVRYQRVQKRGTEKDSIDFETFRAQEEKEKSGTGAQQDLSGVAAFADYQIANDGTFAQLYKKIDEVIAHAGQD